MEENIANKMVCPRCKSPNIEYADGTYRCQDCRCEWRLSDEVSPKAKSLTIRNSTMEFLIIQFFFINYVLIIRCRDTRYQQASEKHL